MNIRQPSTNQQTTDNAPDNKEINPQINFHYIDFLYFVWMNLEFFKTYRPSSKPNSQNSLHFLMDCLGRGLGKDSKTSDDFQKALNDFKNALIGLENEDSEKIRAILIDNPDLASNVVVFIKKNSQQIKRHLTEWQYMNLSTDAMKEKNLRYIRLCTLQQEEELQLKKQKQEKSSVKPQEKSNQALELAIPKVKSNFDHAAFKNKKLKEALNILTVNAEFFRASVAVNATDHPSFAEWVTADTNRKEVITDFSTDLMDALNFSKNNPAVNLYRQQRFIQAINKLTTAPSLMIDLLNKNQKVIDLICDINIQSSSATPIAECIAAWYNEYPNENLKKLYRMNTEEDKKYLGILNHSVHFQPKSTNTVLNQNPNPEEEQHPEEKQSKKEPVTATPAPRRRSH